MTDSATRLLLADDHVLFRETLAEYLSRDAHDFEITEADNFAEVVTYLQTQKFDVVVLDWHMSGFAKFDALEALTLSYPEQKIIVMSGIADPSVIKKLHAMRIQGFIPKTVAGGDFVSTLKDILNNEVRLLSEPTSYRDYPNEALLTDRQAEVLDQLKQGLSNKEIARELNISEVTVKQHVQQILEKFKCKTRSALIAQWIK